MATTVTRTQFILTFIRTVPVLLNYILPDDDLQKFEIEPNFTQLLYKPMHLWQHAATIPY